MIFAHGYKKIAQKYVALKRTMPVHDIQHIAWPGHFGLTMHKQDEDTVNVSIFGGTEKDVASLTKALKIELNYDAS